MRILITGGAGFIGGALANRLVLAGHDVLALDNLSSGDPSRLTREVLFTRGDVRDVPKLWTLLQGVDCVYHLAARVSVPESVLYPRDYNEVNVGGTVALMEAVRDVGVRRVVLASSGTVYGTQPSQPVHEGMQPHPLAPYAVSKVAAEYYVHTLGALYDVQTVALRIFNAYGPGQFIPAAPAPVIPLFMWQAVRGASLVVFGDGEQTRDFIYIDDVVEALVAAATAESIDRQTINVGSGQEVSIDQLIELIARTVHRRLDTLYNHGESGGVPRMVADLTVAGEKLGFAPQTSLEDGLRRLLDLDPRFSMRQK